MGKSKQDLTTWGLLLFSLTSTLLFAIDFPCRRPLLFIANRDEPLPVVFDNWGVTDGKFLFQRRVQPHKVVQSVAEGKVELGDMVEAGGQGILIQVDSHPGGTAYRNDPTVHEGSPKKQDIALGHLIRAVRETPSASGALNDYTLLLGDNVAMPGLIRKIKAPTPLSVEKKKFIETPVAWEHLFEEGREEVWMGRRPDKTLFTYKTFMTKQPCLAAQLAKATGKPVIAPVGKLRMWYDSFTNELRVSVLSNTVMNAWVEKPNQAFVKFMPDGTEHPVENPAAFLTARSDVKIKFVNYNAELDDPRILKAGSN